VAASSHVQCMRHLAHGSGQRAPHRFILATQASRNRGGGHFNAQAVVGMSFHLSTTGHTIHAVTRGQDQDGGLENGTEPLDSLGVRVSYPALSNVRSNPHRGGGGAVAATRDTQRKIVGFIVPSRNESIANRRHTPRPLSAFNDLPLPCAKGRHLRRGFGLRLSLQRPSRPAKTTKKRPKKQKKKKKPRTAGKRGQHTKKKREKQAMLSQTP